MSIEFESLFFKFREIMSRFNSQNLLDTTEKVSSFWLRVESVGKLFPSELFGVVKMYLEYVCNFDVYDKKCTTKICGRWKDKFCVKLHNTHTTLLNSQQVLNGEWVNFRLMCEIEGIYVIRIGFADEPTLMGCNEFPMYCIALHMSKVNRKARYSKIAKIKGGKHLEYISESAIDRIHPKDRLEIGRANDFVFWKQNNKKIYSESVNFFENKAIHFYMRLGFSISEIKFELSNQI